MYLMTVWGEVQSSKRIAYPTCAPQGSAHWLSTSAWFSSSVHQLGTPAQSTSSVHQLKRYASSVHQPGTTAQHSSSRLRERSCHSWAGTLLCCRALLPRGCGKPSSQPVPGSAVQGPLHAGREAGRKQAPNKRCSPLSRPAWKYAGGDAPQSKRSTRPAATAASLQEVCRCHLLCNACAAQVPSKE